jgi:uncharacterized membrane protein
MRGPRLFAAAVAIALPFAVHFLTLDESVRPAVVAFGWAMTLAVAIGLARGFRIAALEAALVVGVIGAAWYGSLGTTYAVFVPSVAIDLLLLWLFARTLAPGRQPLVSAIASIVRGELPPELARYTRAVTWFWCLFFAALALTSVLLAAFAPLAIWSLFANLLVYPFIALMLVLEYAYRRRRFPQHVHFSPLTVAKRLVQAGYFRSAPSAK